MDFMPNFQLGLKLGSPDKQYTEHIRALHEKSVFQYIELFVVPGTFADTIDYWKQFSISFGIHAPHSGRGLNPAQKEKQKENEIKIKEAFQFADSLNAEYIVFHPGLDGNLEETIKQFKPYMDERCLIENKPVKGLGSEHCLGFSPAEIKFLMDELKIDFCLDFGHAICAANSLGKDPLSFVEEFLPLSPALYHLTDGDCKSEFDEHLHYGEGTFPLKRILGCIPKNAKVTNEAKHNSQTDLNDFEEDAKTLCSY